MGFKKPISLDIKLNETSLSQKASGTPGEIDISGALFLQHYQFTGGSTNHRDIQRMKNLLSAAIQTELTDRQRECLILYYLKGLQMNQIAVQLNLNPSTVSRHISAARRKLKKLRRYL